MFSVVTGYISVLLYPVIIGTPYSKTKRYKHRISWLLWPCTWFPKLHCNEKAVQVWTCCLSRWHCHKRCQEAKEGLTQVYYYYSSNRPFAGSGHMVLNKLHWDANDAVELPKQRNSYQSSPTFLCFESPTASFASQCNLFRTMWPDPAKGLLYSKTFLVMRSLARSLYEDISAWGKHLRMADSKVLSSPFLQNVLSPVHFFCFFTSWDLYELQHSVKSYWGDKKLFWEF